MQNLSCFLIAPFHLFSFALESTCWLVLLPSFIDLPMALTASKIPSSPVRTSRTSIPKTYGIYSSFCKSTQHCGLHSTNHGDELRRQGSGHFLTARCKFPKRGFWHICGKTGHFVSSRGSSVLCWFTETKNSDTKQCVENYSDCSDVPR